MLRLLQSLPLKGIADSLRAGAARFPFRLDAPSLAPDELPADDTAPPLAADHAAALEARVLEILRDASKGPPGPQRREALAEVNDLRQQAIALRRRAAEHLKAQLAATKAAAR